MKCWNVYVCGIDTFLGSHLDSWILQNKYIVCFTWEHFRKHWHDVFIKNCVSTVIWYETLQDKNFHLYINYRNSAADTATASLIFTWDDKSDISTFPESWRVTDFTPPSTTFLATDEWYLSILNTFSSFFLEYSLQIFSIHSKNFQSKTKKQIACFTNFYSKSFQPWYEHIGESHFFHGFMTKNISENEMLNISS